MQSLRTTLIVALLFIIAACGSSTKQGLEAGIGVAPTEVSGPIDLGGPTTEDEEIADGGMCAEPTRFAWKSTEPLMGPDASHVSIKDPSVVRYAGQWHVFASTVDSMGNYTITYVNFGDWARANAAPHTKIQLGGGYRAAPQVFYFRPQRKWYMVFDPGPLYTTTDDITKPSTWVAPLALGAPQPSGALDHWIICDDANCYLFASADNGKWYRNQTTVAAFPGGWGPYTVVMEDPDKNRLFEACNVYRMKGTGRYLALVEAIDHSAATPDIDASSGIDAAIPIDAPAGIDASPSLERRYFRSWTADRLDGTWTPLADSFANPFASASNVAFAGAAWTDDISHGEMVRSGYDQTMTIDTCKLQYLYQGLAPGLLQSTKQYNLLPWKLGLLTQD